MIDDLFIFQTELRKLEQYREDHPILVNYLTLALQKGDARISKEGLPKHFGVKGAAAL